MTGETHEHICRVCGEYYDCAEPYCDLPSGTCRGACPTCDHRQDLECGESESHRFRLWDAGRGQYRVCE